MSTEELDHAEWYPLDWLSAPSCGCGHSKYQHIQSDSSDTRLDCLYEADKPPDARCRAYEPFERLTLW